MPLAVLLPIFVVALLNWFLSSDFSRFSRPLNDREVAVISFKPKRILQNPYTWSTRFDRLVPSHISPSQLAAVGVDSLLIRAELGNPQDRNRALGNNRLRWSAVAKLEKPLEIDDFFNRWQTATVIRSQPIDVEIVEASKGRTLARVPAGTFLAPAVRSGELHYEDSWGKRLKRGVYVGLMDTYWEFVEGGSGQRAVFHFSGLTEDSLTSDSLFFQLLCCDFRIHDQDNSRLRLNVQLKNKASRLTSKPMIFDVRPQEQFVFKIPRAVALDSGASKLEADLLRDFLAEGELEVLLSLDQPDRYFGVGKNSLQIQSQAHEFLTILEDTIIVADTLESLHTLIEDPKIRNQPQSDHDLICSVHIDTPEKKSAVEYMLNGNAGMDLERDWFQAIYAFHAQVDCLPEIKLRVDLGTEATSIAQNEKRSLVIIDRCTEQLASAINFTKLAEGSIHLLQPVFGGRSMKFPVRAPLDAERYSELLKKYIGTVKSTTWIHAKRNRIRLDLSQPNIQFHDQAERTAFLANVQFAWAVAQFENFQHELSDYGLEQTLMYLPDDTTLRLRIAHQLAFNMSLRFRGEAAYRWIRRALAMLLDGIEADPENYDGYWSAAKVVTCKATLEEVRGYFEEDEELQTRLRRIIASSDESPQDWNPNGWIVARRLLARAIDCYEKSGSAGEQKPVLLYSDEAMTHSGYAKFLAEEGRFDESQLAWESAMNRFEQLNHRRIITIDSKLYCLHDLVALQKQTPVDDILTKQLLREWLRTGLEFQSARAGLHLMAPMRQADRAFYDAQNALANGDRRLAASILKNAFEKLADSYTKDAELTVLARCIEPEWLLYRWLCRIEEGKGSTNDGSTLRKMERAFETLSDRRRNGFTELSKDDPSNPK